jgi:hypothetical protein
MEKTTVKKGKAMNWHWTLFLTALPLLPGTGFAQRVRFIYLSDV